MNQNLPPAPKMTTKEKMRRGAKIIFVIGSFIFLIFNTVYGLANPITETDCVSDLLFSITEPINTFLSEKALLKRYVLITTSLMIDGMVLTTMAHWSFYGKSFRFFFSFVIFYVFHMIVRVRFYTYYLAFIFSKNSKSSFMGISWISFYFCKLSQNDFYVF